MEVSVSVRDNNENPPLLKAKLLISIFNQPFTSVFTTAANSFSDLSISLSTNYPSGPSFKLTYTPSSSIATPLSLSLRSGLGLFGSPHNSPLIFSANFPLSHSGNSGFTAPTFSLHFKPQLGHFSLYKRTSPSSDLSSSSSHSSSTCANLDYGSASNSELSNGFSPDGSLGWQEVKLEPCDNGKEKEGQVYRNGFLADRQMVWRGGNKGGFLSGGIAARASTVLPLSKGLMVYLRWGVHLPGGDFGVKMPYLTLNKIKIGRMEEVKEIKKDNSESKVGDSELLRGICFWMKRDLEVLEKENIDIRQSLEDMRFGVSNSNGVPKKAPAPSASGNRFGSVEHQRSNRNGREANQQRELKKPVNQAADLENELQRAIKAASL